MHLLPAVVSADSLVASTPDARVSSQAVSSAVVGLLFVSPYHSDVCPRSRRSLPYVLRRCSLVAIVKSAPSMVAVVVLCFVIELCAGK